MSRSVPAVFLSFLIAACLASPLQLSSLARTGSGPEPPGQVDTLPLDRTQSLPHELSRVPVRDRDLQDRTKLHKFLQAEAGIPDRLKAELHALVTTELRLIHTLLPSVYQAYVRARVRGDEVKDDLRQEWERRGWGYDGGHERMDHVRRQMEQRGFDMDALRMFHMKQVKYRARAEVMNGEPAYWSLEESMSRLRKALFWRVGGRDVPAAVPSTMADAYKAYQGLQEAVRPFRNAQKGFRGKTGAEEKRLARDSG